MNRETGTLRISMVTEEDRGEYFCIANTTGQKLVRSLPARLRVKRKNYFIYFIICHTGEVISLFSSLSHELLPLACSICSFQLDYDVSWACCVVMALL